MVLRFLLQMSKMNPGYFCCAFILCLLVAFTFTSPVAKKEVDFQDTLPAESKIENDAAVEQLFQKRSSICCKYCPLDADFEASSNCLASCRVCDY